MFSDLYKVTQTPPTASAPRPHESDTREEIRRHDPDHDHNKKKNHKDLLVEQGLFGDDLTEISVESLETFLPMLLRNFSAKKTFSEHSASSTDRPHSGPNAKAAGAYARRAQYNPANELQQKVKEVQEERQPKKELNNPTLSTAEVQAIHRLQTDVAELRRRGIKSVYIDKAGSLLESLQSAVTAALV
ncbi:MAG: hypothetical protein H6857_02635 [Rhodospirillales bacterium]|nr:hypothetical protein [Rhodospirillales bacterium]MCB9980711.1 hypothetical protein [Rhodospirillales bacterium]